MPEALLILLAQMEICSEEWIPLIPQTLAIIGTPAIPAVKLGATNMCVDCVSVFCIQMFRHRALYHDHH